MRAAVFVIDLPAVVVNICPGIHLDDYVGAWVPFIQLFGHTSKFSQEILILEKTPIGWWVGMAVYFLFIFIFCFFYLLYPIIFYT